MKLDQFMKWKGWVSTGGEAKQRIQMGEVTVNGAVEIRRGRQLSAGDRPKRLPSSLFAHHFTHLP